MATYITKPEVDLREELNRARRPIGNIGNQLYESQTVEEVHRILGGRKNLIINGAFDIWQRATSAEGAGNTFLCADRWFCYSNQSRFERSESVPSNQGFNYSMKMSNFNSTLVLDQPIELPVPGKNWIFTQGKTFTVSYWARSTKPIKLLNRFVFRQDAGSSTNEVSPSGLYDNNQNHQLSSEWKRYWHTYTFPYFTLGSGITNLTLSIRSSDGAALVTPTSGTEVYITGIQIEEGPTMSPFEHRGYGEELALCQRYYEKIVGSTPWFMAHGYGTEVYCNIPFNTSKRTGSGTLYYSDPSGVPAMVTMYGNTSGSGGPDGLITGIVASNVTAHSMSFYFQMSASTYTPHGTSVMFRFDTNHWIAYDVEL
jgi:hypothetical protein